MVTMTIIQQAISTMEVLVACLNKLKVAMVYLLPSKHLKTLRSRMVTDIGNLTGSHKYQQHGDGFARPVLWR